MRRGISQAIATATLLLTAGQAMAQGAAPPAWAGVWRGTLGKAPVQLCLTAGSSENFGAYYYLRHLVPIRLTQSRDHPSQWLESLDNKDPKAPVWRLVASGPNRIKAVWEQGGKALPITLDRVPLGKPGLDEGGRPCGSLAFSLPRWTKPVITTARASFHGVVYQRVMAAPGPQFSDSDTETFQLAGASPALARVNAALYKGMPTKPGDADYFTCAMSALGSNGYDGDAMSTTTPSLITASWMSASTSASNDCGGAHPNHGNSYQTWNLAKGQPVDLYGWFSPAALTRKTEGNGRDSYTTITFTPAFRTLIDKAYGREDDECSEAVADADTWSPRLTIEGIAFSPDLPHVSFACTDDAVIPYARLSPYLNPAGRSAMASLVAEIRALSAKP